MHMPISPQDTRSVLLEAALLCFAEHGYSGTSIRMVAKEANRPLSLIAHHFGNKEGLYREVFRAMFQASAFAQTWAPGVPIPVPASRREAILQFREHVHLMFGEICPWVLVQDPKLRAAVNLWMREAFTPRPEIQDVMREHLTPRSQRLKACLQVLRPDLGEAELLLLGTSMQGLIVGHGLMHGLHRLTWGETTEPLAPFRAAELLVEFCLRGLGVAPEA